MGKKMKLPILSNQTTEPKSTTWPWPSCAQTRTLSFRTAPNNNVFKTINSAFIDSTTTTTTTEPPLALEYSLYTNSSSSESASFSTNSDDPPSSGAGAGDPVEAVIQGLRSTERRLFFEPGDASTASILTKANKKEEEEEEKLLLVLEDNNSIKKVIPYKESVALSMESRNPYLDFKKSMEEMVEAHGLKGWESLEELLSWYLKMNGKDNHGFIVGAFVDLLVGIAFSSSSSSTNNNIDNKSSSSSTSSNCNCSNNCDSPYSPLSFCNTSSSSSCSSSLSSSSTPCVSSIEVGELEIESTPCLASLLEIEEEKNVEEDDDGISS
ncbi:transcription repressor OFP15-like [Humulus lupulus]|uniref:transcription repressor OFP15-like n=1 Tax=Humulus lupulus TaxID=3486 RepID=UPI002B40562C|nr:transcription repressor OFP15-like [Humulus lupulus]